MFAKQFKMKQKNKNVYFSVFLGTLGASLLGNLLRGKGVKVMILGKGVMKAGPSPIRAGEGPTRAGQNYQCCLIF